MAPKSITTPMVAAAAIWHLPRMYLWMGAATSIRFQAPTALILPIATMVDASASSTAVLSARAQQVQLRALVLPTAHQTMAPASSLSAASTPKGKRRTVEIVKRLNLVKVEPSYRPTRKWKKSWVCYDRHCPIEEKILVKDRALNIEHVWNLRL